MKSSKNMNDLKTNDRLFTCQRCGRCCIEIILLTVTSDDLDRWYNESRFDILQYVLICLKDGQWINGSHWKGEPVMGGDVWFHPKTGEELDGRCPFVRKLNNENRYKCRIHDTKPIVCKNYPFNNNQNGVCIRMKSLSSSELF